MADQILAAMLPQPQVTKQRKVINPRIAVACTIGKEYEVGSGIFNIPTMIELFYDIPQSGQEPEIMEDSVRRIDDILTKTQAAGQIGIVRTGSGKSLQGVVAKRTISLTIIAS